LVYAKFSLVLKEKPTSTPAITLRLLSTGARLALNPGSTSTAYVKEYVPRLSLAPEILRL
jgi:hypothetical protein